MMLADALVVIMISVGLVLAIPAVILLLEVLASLFYVDADVQASAGRPRIGVLVPAHNEASTIVDTLASIRSQLAGGDRIVVIADNCTDETATIARASGAEAIVRTDGLRRGKGYALDFGIRHLAQDPPTVVIVIDADCQPSPGCLGTIASLAAATQRPVQAHDRIVPPPGGRSPYLSVASLAVRVKNLSRPLGCRRLGLACQLMGTGMAFPWAIIDKVDFATSEIVEDLTYGLKFARAGHAPLFCPSASVVSEFPVSLEGQTTQRERWEAGHLHIIATQVFPMILNAVRRADFVLLALALDAAVPPLAFFTLAIAAFAVVSVPIALLANAPVLLSLALAVTAILGCAVMLAWWRVGRDVISFRDMTLSVPRYVLSKLGVYGHALIGRKIEWIRTKRGNN